MNIMFDQLEVILFAAFCYSNSDVNYYSHPQGKLDPFQNESSPPSHIPIPLHGRWHVSWFAAHEGCLVIFAKTVKAGKIIPCFMIEQISLYHFQHHVLFWADRNL